MFREIFLSASIAGLLAALILTLLQMVWVTPLILHAETYEDAPASAPIAALQAAPAAGTDAHEHPEAAHERMHNHDQYATTAIHEHDHHHDADDWKPTDGIQRTLFTLTSNVVMGVAYALLLIGVYTVWRRPQGLAQGLLFGLAGFAVFFAAPGLGLPPELPGTEVAALAARQQWWIGTAVATALGLALLFVQRNGLLRGAGVLLLVAPHLLGAPHLATETSLAPAELQTHFRLATAACNAVFWLLLGTISAVSLQKLSAPQPEN
jgi:cobalt transporter subunit CbtA